MEFELVNENKKQKDESLSDMTSTSMIINRIENKTDQIPRQNPSLNSNPNPNDTNQSEVWKPGCLDKCLGCSHGSPKNAATTGYLLLRVIQAIFVVHAGVIFAGILTFQALELTNCATSDDDGGTCGDSSSTSSTSSSSTSNVNDSNCEKLWGLIKPDSLLTVIASVAGMFTAIVCPFVGTAMDFTPYRKHIGAISVIICTVGTALCCSLIVQTEVTVTICSIGFFLIYVFKDFLSMASDSYVPELSSVHYEVSAAVSSSLTWIFITEVSYILICVVLSAFVSYSVYGTIVSAVTTVVVWCLLPIAYERMPHVEASRCIPDGQSLVMFSGVRLKDLSIEVYHYYTDIGLLFLANMVFDPALNAIFIAAILILVSFDYTSSQVTIVLFIAIISAIPGSMASKWIVHVGVDDSDDISENVSVGESVGVGNVTNVNDISMGAGQSDNREGEKHICHMKWSLVVGLLACGVVTILAAYTMQSCAMYLAVLYGVLWGFGLAWCWNTSNMLRNALVPGGSEAEFSGLSFSSVNIIAWLPPLVFTIANEMGNVGDATLSLLGFLVLGAMIVGFMDVPRGLNARRVTLDKRRWVVKANPPNIGVGIDTETTNTNTTTTTTTTNKNLNTNATTNIQMIDTSGINVSV